MPSASFPEPNLGMIELQGFGRTGVHNDSKGELDLTLFKKAFYQANN
jgi:hypothetical protein